MQIIIAIILFSAIILFHELGHFLVAKKNDVKVNEFCLGLGPTIVGFHKGETFYSLKLLPFGGACMMEGEDEDSDSDRAFNKKTVFQRFAIVFAGPFFNFILAFIFAVIIISFRGIDTPVIGGIIDNSPAYEAGIEAGDKIVSIDDHRVYLYREISLYNYFNNDNPVTVKYIHNGEKKTVSLTPTIKDESGRKTLGFTSSGRTRVGVLKTIGYGVAEVRYWIWSTIRGLGKLVTGRLSLNDLSGPVGIIRTIGNTYTESVSIGVAAVIFNMMNMCMFLSANLGIMNLLPLPALDGGRLIFFIIEMIRRKRLDPGKEGMVHIVGLVVLLAFMGVIMFNDIRLIFVR